MLSFRAASFSTFVMSDVQSFCRSIMNSGLIPGGQNLSNRQTKFFLVVKIVDKRTQNSGDDRLECTASCTVFASSMEETSKHGVCAVDIKLAQMKGLKFYQTRSNAIILYNTLPAYCIPRVVRMDTGEIINEEVYESLRPPPKISMRNN